MKELLVNLFVECKAPDKSLDLIRVIDVECNNCILQMCCYSSPGVF